MKTKKSIQRWVNFEIGEVIMSVKVWFTNTQHAIIHTTVHSFSYTFYCKKKLFPSRNFACGHLSPHFQRCMKCFLCKLQVKYRLLELRTMTVVTAGFAHPNHLAASEHLQIHILYGGCAVALICFCRRALMSLYPPFIWGMECSQTTFLYFAYTFNRKSICNIPVSPPSFSLSFFSQAFFYVWVASARQT